MVQLLLTEGKADPNKRIKCGGTEATPLIVATLLGKSDVIRSLLTKTPNLEFSVDGATPLTAAEKGHVDAAKLLIAAGANKDSMLEVAKQYGQIEFIAAMSESDTPSTLKAISVAGHPSSLMSDKVDYSEGSSAAAAQTTAHC